jgi:hypothetical protein
MGSSKVAPEDCGCVSRVASAAEGVAATPREPGWPLLRECFAGAFRGDVVAGALLAACLLPAANGGASLAAELQGRGVVFRPAEAHGDGRSTARRAGDARHGGRAAASQSVADLIRNRRGNA